MLEKQTGSFSVGEMTKLYKKTVCKFQREERKKYRQKKLTEELLIETVRSKCQDIIEQSVRDFKEEFERVARDHVKRGQRDCSLYHKFIEWSNLDLDIKDKFGALIDRHSDSLEPKISQVLSSILKDSNEEVARQTELYLNEKGFSYCRKIVCGGRGVIISSYHYFWIILVK